MIAISLARHLAGFLRHPAHGVGVGACTALVPKCVLCLAAYAGAGAAGREICGATAAPGTWPVLVPLLGWAVGTAGSAIIDRLKRT